MTVHPLAPIVVGIDGSPGSRAAADWAAREATRRRLPVRLVHGYQPPLPTAIGSYPVPVPVVEAGMRHTVEVLREATDRLRRSHPDLVVHAAHTVGNPAGVLVAESERASCLVVGARGTGGFTELLVGSVATQVAAHAHCPVIVVRPGSVPPQAPVVIGLDGSEQSSAALPFAFDAAAARGVPLVGLYVWQSLPSDNLGPVNIWSKYQPAEAAEEARRLLAEQLAGWQGKYPDITVEHRAVYGINAAEVLIDASRTACLIVLGCRGRGGFASLLLGSVSRTLVNHAACSVAVVHAHQDAGAAR